MQLILFLLGLFAIGCMLYGISAGVQIIVRGFSRLAEGTRIPPTNGTVTCFATSCHGENCQ